MSIMKTQNVKLPAKTLDEVRRFCTEETNRIGQFYSISRFLREAAQDKISKIKTTKTDRVERRG